MSDANGNGAATAGPGFKSREVIKVCEEFHRAGKPLHDDEIEVELVCRFPDVGWNSNSITTIKNEWRRQRGIGRAPRRDLTKTVAERLAARPAVASSIEPEAKPQPAPRPLAVPVDPLMILEVIKREITKAQALGLAVVCTLDDQTVITDGIIGRTLPRGVTVTFRKKGGP